MYGDPARIINVRYSTRHWRFSRDDLPSTHQQIYQIGSVEGIGVPFHETYAYSASKAALHHLSRHLASRLGWEGITANTIAFGWFESKSVIPSCFLVYYTDIR